MAAAHPPVLQRAKGMPGAFWSVVRAVMLWVHRLVARLVAWLGALLHPPQRSPAASAVATARATHRERESLLMSFAAYFATEWLGDRDYIERETARTLRAFLERPDIAELVADPTGDSASAAAAAAAGGATTTDKKHDTGSDDDNNGEEKVHKKKGKKKKKKRRMAKEQEQEEGRVEEGEEETERGYELVWGPACYQAGMSMVADNTMFVARRRDDPARLYIGVAGTHPLSLFSWLFHDFDVYNLVEWPYARRTDEFYRIVRGAHGGSAPAAATAAADAASAQAVDALDCSESDSDHRLMVSQGTFRGLKTLVAMQDPATKQPLLRFLAEQCEAFHRAHADSSSSNSSGGNCTERTRLDITVTGHSLGGALCHALALYLHDNVSVWDAHDCARLACVSFAGPTIGNRLLARYYDACLGARSRRVANMYDIVPHAWDSEYMPQMYHIYEPHIATPVALEVLLQVFVSTITPKHYAHVCDAQKFFAGPTPDPANDFVAEVMAQHSKSYFTHYRLNALAPLIAEHAPLFREAFCDGTFTSATMRTIYNMFSQRLARAVGSGPSSTASAHDDTGATEDTQVEVLTDETRPPKHTLASTAIIYADMLRFAPIFFILSSNTSTASFHWRRLLVCSQRRPDSCFGHCQEQTCCVECSHFAKEERKCHRRWCKSERKHCEFSRRCRSVK